MFGLYIHTEADAQRFLKEQVPLMLRGDRFAHRVGKLPRRGRDLTKCSVMRRLNPALRRVVSGERDGQLLAVRISDDVVVVWTTKCCFKEARSPAARKRALFARAAVSTLGRSGPVPAWLVLPEYIDDLGSAGTAEFIERSERAMIGLPHYWLLREPARLDQIMHCFLYARIMAAEATGAGIEHGDLHIGNLGIVGDGAAKAIDLDMVRPDGAPYLDVLHFCLHLVRLSGTSVADSVEMLLARPDEVFQRVMETGLKLTATLAWERYEPGCLAAYFERRLLWQRRNRGPDGERQFRGLLQMHGYPL